MEKKYESLLRYACRRKTEMKLRTKNVTCAGGFGRTGKKNLPGKVPWCRKLCGARRKKGCSRGKIRNGIMPASGKSP